MSKFIRLNELKSRTGLSRSSIYSMISQGRFPLQVPIGQRAVGWVEEEVSRWIDARIAHARNGDEANV